MIEENDYCVYDKNENPIEESVDVRFKEYLQRYINHPKYKEWTEKKFMESICSGELVFDTIGFDKVIKEIDCVYNDGLYCSKGLPGTKCDLNGCVAHTNKTEE